MRILIVGPAYPYRGGIASYNERMARQFQQEGHEVEMLTFRLQYPAVLFPGKTQYAEGSAPEGLQIRRGLNSLNPLSWWGEGSRCRKRKYSLVIVRYWLPFLAPCLGTFARRCRGKNTKVIALADNVIPHERRVGDRLFSRYFLRSMDGYVTMAASVEEELSRFDKTRPRLRTPHPLFDHYGERMERTKALEMLQLDPEKRYFLFFGFIREYKGLDLLLKAFADASISKEKYHLLVAGEFYSDKAPYTSLISTLGLEQQVHLFDRFIPDGEVATFFSAADLVVQPYRNASQSGVSQIAYHFEVPMIVTDVGGLGEMVPDGKVGFTCDPEPSSITGAIQRFLQHEKPETLLEGIREEKKRFSWERLTANIGELYQKLI